MIKSAFIYNAKKCKKLVGKNLDQNLNTNKKLNTLNTLHKNKSLQIQTKGKSKKNAF